MPTHRGTTMEEVNKRKHPRIGSAHLVSYVCLDEGDRKATTGMGRTLNVSEGGVLLETYHPVDPYSTVVFSIAMEDELMEIRGRVAYSQRRPDGKYETGVEFVAGDEKMTRFLRQFISLFQGEARNFP